MMFKETIEYIDEIIKADNDKTLKELLSKSGFNEVDLTVKQVNKIEKDLSKILDNFKTELLLGIDKSKTVEALKKLIDKNYKKADFTKILSNFFEGVFSQNIESLSKKFIKAIDKDLSFKYFCKATTDFIKSWSSTLADLIQVQSHENLSKVLEQALASGDSVEETALALMDSYAFSRNRARKIAITEMLRAHSYAKNDAFIQSPAVTGVKWKHSGGKGIKPRQHHVALDGTVISKGEKFTIYSPHGTFEAKFPRDSSLPASEVVHCHCTHGPVVDNKILGLTKKEKKALQLEGIKEADAIYGSP